MRYGFRAAAEMNLLGQLSVEQALESYKTATCKKKSKMVSSPAKSVIFFQLIIFLAQNEDSLSLKRLSIIKKEKY